MSLVVFSDYIDSGISKHISKTDKFQRLINSKCWGRMEDFYIIKKRKCCIRNDALEPGQNIEQMLSK